MKNVVKPTTDSIERKNALPGHAWPPSSMR